MRYSHLPSWSDRKHFSTSSLHSPNLVKKARHKLNDQSITIGEMISDRKEGFPRCDCNEKVRWLSERGETLVVYALCGFSNLGAMVRWRTFLSLSVEFAQWDRGNFGP